MNGTITQLAAGKSAQARSIIAAISPRAEAATDVAGFADQIVDRHGSGGHIEQPCELVLETPALGRMPQPLC
ncbi:hypothetical protein [Dactylosporangium matsuzakiense]|uniref:hypothetical protein n=1 Tax=Dactylosporangium matsuzakiense TaxID=53360 RepID=UPI0021C3CCF2|nr:hypothetical protein [Dactylosporangium matsuzakiense]UWZ48343.1 hypothetical protein Dmats_19195 [Dactylosporangium matsuzakiense]